MEVNRDYIKAKAKGKNTKFEVEVNKDYIRGKVKGTKKIKDTEYSDSMEVKRGNGRTDISGKGGKTKTTKKGPNYTKKGQEHEGSLSLINDGNKKGVEVSYGNKQINGNGKKIGDKDISDTNTRERRINGGVTQDKNGNINMKGKYEDSNKNTHKIESGEFKAEKSKKDFSQTEVNANVVTKNGQTTATVGVGDSRGTQHSVSAQFGDHYKAEA